MEQIPSNPALKKRTYDLSHLQIDPDWKPTWTPADGSVTRYRFVYISRRGKANSSLVINLLWRINTLLNMKMDGRIMR